MSNLKNSIFDSYIGFKMIIDNISISKQLVIPVPGVGAAVGGIVGGIIGSIAAGSVAKKVSGKIFDNNILEKCPLCRSS